MRPLAQGRVFKYSAFSRAREKALTRRPPNRLQARPGVPLLTVATDMDSSELHCWIDPFLPDSPEQRAAAHTIVAGGRRLQRQAEEAGWPIERIMRTDGMVVHPAFYRAPATADQVSDAGQEHSVRTVVIFFGGFAPPRVEQIAANLLTRFGERVRVVLLCGANDSLRAHLERRAHAARRAAASCGEGAGARGSSVGWASAQIVGFVDAAGLAQHMCGASAVLGKPGPGAASEAQVVRVPFVTESCNTMPQEKSVADWLLETGYGLVIERLEACPNDLFEQVEACCVALRQSPPNLAVFQVAACVLSHASVSDVRHHETVTEL